MPDLAPPGARRAARHVVLIGAMGSGKSTVGTALAAALGRPFVDNDAQLRAATGATAADLAARDGVDALHAAEAALLCAALRAPDSSVIAAAASTIADAAVRAALGRDAFVVWLRADAATLVARMPQSASRPFGAEDPSVLVVRQARERDALFAGAADLVVETDRAPVAEVVARIAGAISTGARGHGHPAP